jgi:MFS family permease
MNVTKDVMQDLMIVYLSGEASADTRTLVEEYLAHNPEMAERVTSARNFGVPMATPPPDLERRALDRTRGLLARKNYLVFFAMLFTWMPLSFSFTFDEKHVTLLFRDNPFWSVALLVIGLAFWVAFLDTSRQLRATGLEPPRTWKARTLWALGGIVVGAPIIVLLADWTGWNHIYGFIALGSGVALAIGEKLGRIPTVDTLRRPTTLFDSEKDRR